MPHQNTTAEVSQEHQAAVLSFEVLEVVSMLAAFEERISGPRIARDEDYDPFAPGFPGTQ